MKKILTIYVAALLSTVVTFVGMAGTVAAAGAASLSLSPNGGSHTVNTTFAVTISENSGSDTVNVVEADLSYDTSHLQLASISCNTGAFEVNAPGSGSGVTCGTATAKSGGQVVAVANFKVLAAGSGAVNFAGTSHIYSSATNADVWNGVTTGSSYTGLAVAAPVAAAPVKKATTSTTAQAAAPTVTAASTTTSSEKVATKPVVAAATSTKAVVVKSNSKTARNLGFTVLGLVALAAAVVLFGRRRKIASPEVVTEEMPAAEAVTVAKAAKTAALATATTSVTKKATKPKKTTKKKTT